MSTLAGNAQVREGRFERDGRVVAWTEVGDPGGMPLLRIHGTPGSRLSVHGAGVWADRGLLVINPERPGYGISTPLPGHGLGEVADDTAALLAHLDVEEAPVLGFSGGAPYVLALATLHPGRVRAASVVSGVAPATDSDLDLFSDHNARAWRQALDADRAGLRADAMSMRAAVLEDPQGWIGSVLADAPAKDRDVLEDPTFQDGFLVGLVEALRPGIDGWIDDFIALAEPWDFDPAAAEASLTWWHGSDDRNTPVRLVERLIHQMPMASLCVVAGAGHFLHHTHEAEILDDLLARSV